MIIFAVILVLFGGILFFGAPYLPTLNQQVTAALDLADLRPGETLLELGCGDGKVLIAAARRKIRVVGYELNPILALLAWLRTRRFGSLVTVVWANFWVAPWPSANAIFTFLLPKYMVKLDDRIVLSQKKTTKLVSFAFKIPGKEVIDQKDGVFLYVYKYRKKLDSKTKNN